MYPTPSRTARPIVRTRGLRPLGLAALLGASSLSLRCAPLPGEELTGTSAQALTANARTAFNYFLGKGLTPVQAAGVVGNLVQESNVDPTAVQPGGPGRGIAQWSVGGRWDHDAGDNVVAYARGMGVSEWGLALQLDFVWYELTHFSYLGLAQLRAATTVADATRAFEVRYEGCGTCLETQRIAFANQALMQFGTSSWGGQFVSQSFPYASAGAVTIPAGGTHSVSLTMRNIGTNAWDSRTCLGTTVARDRTSPFAGPEWPGPNRPACVPAGTTVAMGATHTFTWVMHAPAATGHYDEHWGMLEEGVTWFSAAGQAGPPDTDLEGLFDVTSAPPGPDAGATDASAADASPRADGSSDARDANEPEVSAGDAARSDSASTGDARVDGGEEGPAQGGCGCRTVGPTRRGRGASLLLVSSVLALARRRRRG